MAVWKVSVWLVSIVLLAGAAGAEQDRGPAEIDLYGGRKGAVHFPHRLHEEKTADCRVCHDMFPPKRGSIQRLIQEGRLEKKEVMNKLCIRCHKEKKRAGEQTGPTTCSKCHNG